ncbi:hypothetical protein [Rhizobium leguminosarum]|uniref:hypothetical protein n=1 Tax=Rhizobium leguminosarum TaxID=384 RepID=UPI0002F8C2F2|nr:hypothetical protein [Rhizobium leguminosarum]
MPGQDPVKLFQTFRARPFGAVSARQAPETLDIEVLRDLGKIIAQRAKGDRRSTQPQGCSDQRCKQDDNDADDAEDKGCELPAVEKNRSFRTVAIKKAAF